MTGWTEVTRNKRKKVVQIFVKVDGMKTVAMEVSPEDKVQKILNTVSGSERVSGFETGAQWRSLAGCEAEEEGTEKRRAR